MSVSGIASPAAGVNSQLSPNGPATPDGGPSSVGMSADTTGSSASASPTYTAQSASPDSATATAPTTAPPKKKHLLLWSIAIGTGLAAAITGIVLLVKHLNKTDASTANNAANTTDDQEGKDAAARAGQAPPAGDVGKQPTPAAGATPQNTKAPHEPTGGTPHMPAGRL